MLNHDQSSRRMQSIVLKKSGNLPPGSLLYGEVSTCGMVACSRQVRVPESIQFRSLKILLIIQKLDLDQFTVAAC
jgi:hypothetical protein